MMIKSHGRQCLTDFVDLLSNQALMTTQLISHLWNIAHGSPAPQPPALAAVATFSIILYECHANTTGTYKNGDAKGILIRMLSYHNPRCTSQNICWWASVILANLSFSAVRWELICHMLLCFDLALQHSAPEFIIHLCRKVNWLFDRNSRFPGAPQLKLILELFETRSFITIRKRYVRTTCMPWPIWFDYRVR